MVVQEVSYRDLAELFQVIGILDCLAATLVADKINSKEFIKIEMMTNKLEHYYNQKEIGKFIDMNYEIHDRIWNHLTNKYLQKSLRHCLVHIKRCNYALSSAFNKKILLDESLNAHKKILEALNKKEKGKLKQIIQKHWNNPLQ